MRTLYIKDVDGASGDVYYYKFAGTSSETKPTRNVATGSEFLEVDTDKKYIYDEDSQTWVEEENQFSELLTEINSCENNKADIIISSASGAIASFADGADNLPLEDCVIQISPVQDLHGQDSPYPAGGGKNKLPFPTAETKGGVTLSYNADGSINLKGEANENVYFDCFAGNFNSTAFVGYILSLGATVTGVSVRVSESDRVAIQSSSNATGVAIEDNGSGLYVAIRIASGTEFASSGDNIYPMLQASTESSTFAPYSNLCPISGWNGLTAWRTGANLFDEQWTQGNIQEGRETDSTTAIRSGFINVLPSTSYYVYTERTANVFIFEYDNEGNYLNRVKNVVTGNVLTTGTGTGKIRIVDRNSGTEAVDTGINYPSTVTTYAPYTWQSYPVTFPDGQTVYGGTVYPLAGKMLVDMAYRQLMSANLGIYDSGYNPNASAAGSRPVVWFKNVFNTVGVKQRQPGGIKAYCNAFPIIFNSTNITASQNRCAFIVDGVSIDSVEDFVSAVQNLETNGDGLWIAYELATPIEIQLDPIAITTLLGDNTIWSDANGTIELDYRADTKLFIAKQKTDIRATIAPIEDGATASQAYSAGKFFYHDGQFCKAKTSIAAGETFTLNTNYQITTVADELFALN